MKKIFLLTTICLALVMVSIVMPSVFDFSVMAENTDLTIDLDSSSKFATYNDVLAYTSNNRLYVAKDNEILSPKNLDAAFRGECIDIAINAHGILLLSVVDKVSELSYFTYSFADENKALMKKNESIKQLNYPVTAIASAKGSLYYLCQDTNTFYIYDFAPNKSNDVHIATGMNFSNTQRVNSFYLDFYDSSDESGETSLYVSSNEKLYYLDGNSGPLTEVTLNDAKVNSISVASNITYLNTSKGILASPIKQNDFKLISDSVNKTSKIQVSTIVSIEYLFISNMESILQYKITADSLEYYNKFDNLEFVHPTAFSIIKVAKLNEDAVLYTSPKNRQEKAVALNGEYILVLCPYEDSATTNSYYYVVTKNNELGYISNSISFTYINPESDASKLRIGNYAQGLHKTTNIYAHPYAKDSIVIDTVDRYTQLVVMDNCAQENGEQVWNYYRVSYEKNGKIVTGFVKTTDVSPFVNLPTKSTIILKSVKIKTASVGQTVKLHVLPSDDSVVVANLTDGTVLDLAESFDEASTWTKVKYKDSFAYVKTADIQKSGLTSLQITVIIISCIVFISTIITLVIILRRKRFGY